MAVQNHNQGSRRQVKDLLKKSNHLFSGQGVPVGLDSQSDLPALRGNQECSQYIEALVVRNARPMGRRLTSARPGALQRRDQRIAAFIFQNEGRTQLLTLFLSSVIPPPSNARFLHRSVATEHAGVAGYSSPSAASRATLHSSYSALQTTARSPVQSGQASNNPRRIRRQRSLCPKPFPVASPAAPTASLVDLADSLSSSWGVSPHPASDTRSARLRSAVLPLPEGSSLVPAEPAPAAEIQPVVHLFLFVSCPYYDTIHDFLYSKINR